MAFNREFRFSKKDIIEIMLMIVTLSIFIIGFKSLHSRELWTGKNNNTLTGYFSITVVTAIIWLYAFIKFCLRHGLTTLAIFFIVAMMAYASSYKVQTLIKAKYLKKSGEEKAIIIKPQNF